MLDYLKAILLGVVEGVTEWLPISSTGHLILFGEILTLSFGNCEARTAELLHSVFDVVIQLGAIFAVVCTYWRKLVPTSYEVRKLYFNLVLATIPAGTIGILADTLCDDIFNKSFDELLFNPTVVAFALIAYGVLFILVEAFTKSRNKAVSSTYSLKPRHAITIGFFQALAIIPGTSRSGATMLGARILGIDRNAAAEFSFFAALPVIFAASTLKIYDLADYTISREIALPPSVIPLLLVASAVAFAVSMISIKFLTEFIKKHSFAPFGIYRIALGIAVMIFLK